MITARQTTDEYGYQILLDGNLRVSRVPLNATKRDPWCAVIKDYKWSTLIDLIDDNKKFSLLASYLVNRVEIPPLTECHYGGAGVVRSIICKDWEYRSNAYRVYIKEVP